MIRTQSSWFDSKGDNWAKEKASCVINDIWHIWWKYLTISKNDIPSWQICSIANRLNECILRGLEKCGYEYCLYPGGMRQKLPIEVTSTCALSDSWREVCQNVLHMIGCMSQFCLVQVHDRDDFCLLVVFWVYEIPDMIINSTFSILTIFSFSGECSSTWGEWATGPWPLSVLSYRLG